MTPPCATPKTIHLPRLATSVLNGGDVVVTHLRMECGAASSAFSLLAACPGASDMAFKEIAPTAPVRGVPLRLALRVHKSFLPSRFQAQDEVWLCDSHRFCVAPEFGNHPAPMDMQIRVVE